MNPNEFEIIEPCHRCGETLSLYKMNISWTKSAIIVAAIGTVLGFSLGFAHLLYLLNKNENLSVSTGMYALMPMIIGLKVASEMKKKITTRCIKCKAGNILYLRLPKGFQGSL